jgi:hypothetical protein
VYAVDALAPQPRGVGGVGKHRLAGGHAGGVEDAAERRQRGEQSQREETEVRGDRDRGDAHTAQDVRHDGRSPPPEAVDDRARYEPGEHERHCGDRRDEADVGCAAP